MVTLLLIKGTPKITREMKITLKKNKLGLWSGLLLSRKMEKA